MDPCKGCDQEKPICCSECDVALLPEASCGMSRTVESNPIEIPDCEKCKGLRQEIEFLRAQRPAPPIAPAQWSTEPPMEFDAWFWWRVPCDPAAPFIVHVVEDCVTHEPLYINGGCDSPLPIGDFIESVGWHEENELEWYSVPISEPPR